MSGGQYSMDKKVGDQTLDFTHIKPYGDTMNDGKTQLSFTRNLHPALPFLFATEAAPTPWITPPFRCPK